MIRFSVIVPNYNHADYLQQRIDSILHQTYPHFELILLDDASTDSSRKILEQYAEHEKISQTIFNEKNSGSVFRQWKKGVEAAAFDWIWIAESDDASDPQFLQRCAEKIAEHPAAGMICTQSTWINNTGAAWFTRRTGFETEGLKNGRAMLLDYMIYENQLKNASAVVFNRALVSRSAWQEVSQYKWCGDWALWNQLLYKSDLYFINQPLNYFRRHAEEASSRYYREGYLYKEGLPLSLQYQHQLDAGIYPRVKAFVVWSGHLCRQYLSGNKPKRQAFFIFRPLYYCIMMHLVLPFVGVLLIIKTIFSRKSG